MTLAFSLHRPVIPNRGALKSWVVCRQILNLKSFYWCSTAWGASDCCCFKTNKGAAIFFKFLKCAVNVTKCWLTLSKTDQQKSISMSHLILFIWNCFSHSTLSYILLLLLVSLLRSVYFLIVWKLCKSCWSSFSNFSAFTLLQSWYRFKLNLVFLLSAANLSSKKSKQTTQLNLKWDRSGPFRRRNVKNKIWGRLHQYFKERFYVCRSQKHKKTLQFDSIFWAFGICARKSFE